MTVFFLEQSPCSAEKLTCEPRDLEKGEITVFLPEQSPCFAEN